MAIVFERERKPVNWIGILTVAFSIGFVVVVAYALFFAPSPQIEVVLPAPLERAKQISSVEFRDPGEVLASPGFKYVSTSFSAGAPTVGALGRPNPFAPF